MANMCVCPVVKGWYTERHSYILLVGSCPHCPNRVPLFVDAIVGAYGEVAQMLAVASKSYWAILHSCDPLGGLPNIDPPDTHVHSH